MNEIPERLICQATLNGKPVVGVMIHAGFGVIAKNAYHFIIGPTNHDGCVVITKDEVLKYADEQSKFGLMDYVNLRGGFSGEISLKVVNPAELVAALAAYDTFRMYAWYKPRYKENLEAALQKPETQSASEIKIKCLI